MSLYRFLRTSALLTLAGKYRSKLYRICIALAVALVSAWLYGDISIYLQNRQPDLLGPALLAKTIIVYGSLAYVFWQLRPGAWSSPGQSKQSGSKHSNSADSAQATIDKTNQPPESGPLDELLDKPELKSRRESILGEPRPKD